MYAFKYKGEIDILKGMAFFEAEDGTLEGFNTCELGSIRVIFENKRLALKSGEFTKEKMV